MMQKVMVGSSGGEPQGNWAERLTPNGRIFAMVILGLGLCYMLGAVAGYAVGSVADGDLPTKRLVYARFIAYFLITGGLAWMLWTVFRAWRTQGLSDFDRRYLRMCTIIVLLSTLAGFALLLGIENPLQVGSALFSKAPIDPTIAIILVIATTLLIAASAVFYHRTIDDHEERAYLWGSTIAFYFVALAFPVAWLLARGGLLPALGISQAMIILFISFVIQFAVWLWFKFR